MFRIIELLRTRNEAPKNTKRGRRPIRQVFKGDTQVEDDVPPSYQKKASEQKGKNITFKSRTQSAKIPSQDGRAKIFKSRGARWLLSTDEALAKTLKLTVPNAAKPNISAWTALAATDVQHNGIADSVSSPRSPITPKELDKNKRTSRLKEFADSTTIPSFQPERISHTDSHNHAENEKRKLEDLIFTLDVAVGSNDLTIRQSLLLISVSPSLLDLGGVVLKIFFDRKQAAPAIAGLAMSNCQAIADRDGILV